MIIVSCVNGTKRKETMRTKELKKKMVDANVNQTMLAEKTGICNSRLSRLFQGKLEYTIDDVKKIAKVLKLSQKDLMNIFFED